MSSSRIASSTCQADKDKVIKEAFRVLKPGGRFAVSDIVTRGEMPEQIRRQVLLWSGCIAGALQDTEYASKLAAAGFEDIGIEPTRIYTGEDAREFASGKGMDVDANRPVHRRQIHERLRARQEACERYGLLRPLLLRCLRVDLTIVRENQ